MAEHKSKRNDGDVEAYLNAIKDEQQRADALTILDIMRKATKAEPRMWGHGLIGFGQYHFKHAGGREGDWFLTGFAPRKDKLSISIMTGFDNYPDLMGTLGKYKTGKACLNIRKLDDVHLPTLRKLVQQSVKDMIKAHK